MKNIVSVTPLLALGEKLGISSEIWEKREELEHITYTDYLLSREKVKNLTLDLIFQLKEEYGNALACVFRLDDLPVLDINQVTDEKDLEEFRRITDGSPTLVFDFALDKKQLIINKFGNVSECNLFLYLFKNSLQNFLTSSLSHLESLLWKLESNEIHKVILLVANHEIWLNGLYIAILGGNKIELWREVISKSSQETDERVRNMYNTCQKNLYWQVPWLKHLTPLHFKIDEQIPCHDPISKTILIHQVNLIILYTADRTTGNINEPILSTYAGTNQSVEITFKNPADQIETEVVANAGYLIDMLEWVYDLRWSSDRLSFVQIVVARALRAADPLVRYQVFLYSAKSIFDELNWHWRSFIENKVDSYVSQVQVLEDYVANTVQQFADQTTGMIKSLSDTTLAAVGALIGSFIAALFKDTFNPKIFAIGMIVYALYVLFFPLIYNMTYQWKHYKMICDNFNDRKKSFQERLYIDKVSEIVDKKITDSEKRFENWFCITFVIYLLIALLAIVTAFWLPGFIQDNTFSIQNVTLSTI